MKKLNKAQKKLLKEKLTRIFNIICYILSALFILTMVIVGVQACQRKPQKQVAETLTMLPQRAININEDNFVYVPSHSGNFVLNSTQSTQIADLYEGIDTSPVDINDPIENRVILYGDNDNYKIAIDNDVYDFLSITISFKPVQEGASAYYRVYNVSVNYFNNGNVNVVYVVSWSSYGLLLNTYKSNINHLSIILLNDPIEEDGFLYWFKQSEYNTFTFNKVFNYNAPISSNLLSPYGVGGVWTSSTNDTAYIDYETGYYISNGELFNKIRVYFYNTTASYYDFNGDIKLGPQNQWSYMFLYYMNTSTNKMVLVNQRDLVAFMPTSSTYGYYNANSSTWINDGYREVIFLEELSSDLENSINSFNNNNQTSYTGYIGSGDVTNVFSLVGSALSGLMPILNTMLLPGITIGMLMFIPLVAMLVFAIIRIIKK